ncbi:hypothetical protein MC7420_2902 [Coleofasciculus chthonoplastes PCC 7420]|uniref:Uncharacterized protein n=1 Tax=Coleofasciculus chthonoplastes PCC 7420 TaxID=118168 RepID=B4VKA8_9CYAN|nr:hypothetical protein MC7420_2902 [Coleofasciculus chthonoplastes PCC 7420]
MPWLMTLLILNNFVYNSQSSPLDFTQPIGVKIEKIYDDSQ